MIIDYFGESTSKGYYSGVDHEASSVPSLLSSALGLTVNNRSKDSVTVDWFIGVKDGDESEYEPELPEEYYGTIQSLANSRSDVVIISLGINDAVSVNLEEFTRDISTLVSNCSYTGKKIYAVLPNEIGSSNESLPDVQEAIRGLPSWVSIISPGTVPRCDDYHPTEEGYITIAAEVTRAINLDVKSIESTNRIVDLYLAMLGVAPEKSGVDYWQGRDFSSQDFVSIIEEYVGKTSDEVFIENLYENLLNRTPDPEGFSYWVQKTSDSSRGETLDLLLSNLDSQSSQDNSTLHTKTSVSRSLVYRGENEVKIDLSGVTSEFYTDNFSQAF